MSKKNESKETKANVIEASADTLTINPKSAPAGMSFEEMQQAVLEFKKLQKIIKAMPKEDREKLLPPVKAREIPESLSDFANDLFDLVKSVYVEFDSEFAKTITLDKPDGNKSISLSREDCKFSIAIIRKSEKKEKESK